MNGGIREGGVVRRYAWTNLVAGLSNLAVAFLWADHAGKFGPVVTGVVIVALALSGIINLRIALP